MLRLALTIAAGILLAWFVLAWIGTSPHRRTREQRRRDLHRRIAWAKQNRTIHWPLTLLCFLVGLIVWTAALILAGLLGADL